MTDPQDIDLISTAKIVGWYGTLSTSAGDADRNPDEAPLSGTVTFTPTVPEITVTSTIPYAQIVLAPFVASLTADGYLSDDGVSPGIYLPNPADPNINPRNWGYSVSYNLAFGGVKRPLGSFSFTFAGTTDVDLGAVAPVASVNGVPVTQGPKGDAGSGLKLRGSVIGTDSSALPTGYLSTQDGYGYRVHSDDFSYDHLWVWVWTGSAGSWQDSGPFNASAIDDSVTSVGSTWSSAKITTIANGAGGNVFIASQDPVSGSYPTRTAVLAAYGYLGDPNVAVVIWTGDNFPPTTAGYALAGRTVTVNGVSMYVEDGFEQRQAG